MQSAHLHPQHTHNFHSCFVRHILLLESVNDWPVFYQLEIIILGGLVWLAGCSIMRLVSHLSDSDRCETNPRFELGCDGTLASSSRTSLAEVVLESCRG